ncbi:MAG: FHA domain-containing protein [Clostridia bacterium]|nr:FHA domain-containing protein [Clostridia bacterium]
MKIARCEAGHFFDSDSFSECPHCKRNAPEKKERRPREVAARPKKSECGTPRLFGKKKSGSSAGEEYEVETAPAISETELARLFGEAPAAQAPKIHKAVKPEPEPSPEKEDELPRDENCPEDSSPSVQTTGGETGEDGQLRQVPGRAPAAEAEGPFDGEAEAVMSFPETVGAYTVFAPSSGRTDLPVGWLVCVGGDGRGKVYSVRSGGNSIGRTTGNDIVINDDRVSREKHARVVYEPRNRVFYIEAGERSGLTYLNGEHILHHATLTAYDRIEIGGGVYLFLPLCGEHFSWDDHPIRDTEA